MRKNYRLERNTRPPRFAVRLLKWFCPPDLHEGIAGDLYEQFYADLVPFSSAQDDRLQFRRAQRKFVWRVLTFFRPGIVLRNRFSIRVTNLLMLKNYFTVSWRHLLRHKTFAAINILGLAVGMAAALLIYEYVTFEKSFDGFHANADHTYRVTTEWNTHTGSHDKRATTVSWSGPGVKQEFPEVIASTRFAPLERFTGENFVHYGNTSLQEQGIFLADPDFLHIFSFGLVKGNASTALVNPASVVITESVARKYFSHEDPMGKVLFIDTHGNLAENNFTVTGIVRDPPANSHLRFDFLVSFNAVWKALENGSTYWHWDFTYVYLLLHPGTNVSDLEKKMSDRRVQQFGHDMQYFSDRIDFRLQPLRDIHLGSSLKGEPTINGDGRSLLFLIVVGVSIIACAYINYVNLSTVKAVERRTEIGIRKIVGSTRRQLAFQLLVESFVMNAIALVVAILFYILCVPALENILNVTWPQTDSVFFSSEFFVLAGCAIAFGVVLSSLYPAFVLSSLRPAEVLKGKAPVRSSFRGLTLRRTLLILQFIFCIVFCVGAFVLYRQLRFMKDHDLGLNPSQVLVVKGYGFQPSAVYERFKAAASEKSFVQDIAFSTAAPGEEIIELSLRPKVAVAGRPEDKQEVKLIAVDGDFFRTLDVTMLTGRGFDRRSATDGKKVIVNEAAASALGYRHAAGILHEAIRGLDEKDLEVIGVVKNYHQRSLKNAYEPIVFVPYWTNNFGWNRRNLFVRLTLADDRTAMEQQIRELEAIWKNFSPGMPFQYFFLDNYFDNQYKADTSFSALFMLFSGLAIVIACLGLFGLVAYATIQRTREIGVRKVMGASAGHILFLLSSDFLKLILIAAIVAVPVIAIGLQQWLNRYAFRIELSAWMFFVPLIVIFILAILTVVLKAQRVASANPVDSLRHE